MKVIFQNDYEAMQDTFLSNYIHQSWIFKSISRNIIHFFSKLLLFMKLRYYIEKKNLRCRIHFILIFDIDTGFKSILPIYYVFLKIYFQIFVVFKSLFFIINDFAIHDTFLFKF